MAEEYRGVHNYHSRQIHNETIIVPMESIPRSKSGKKMVQANYLLGVSILETENQYDCIDGLLLYSYAHGG